MKQFFRTHSYDMVKMFLYQFAIAIFGFSLAFAVGKANSVPLRNGTSIFAILFYLFLLYTLAWDLGYQDKVSVEYGKKSKNLFRGALISVCANAVNFILAFFIMLASVLPESVISNIGACVPVLPY